MTARPRERLGALVGLVACAAAAALALLLASPPAPLPADAPADAFSAERAARHVEVIAARPHPPGSAEHRRVADYLLGELRSLGLEPSVQEGWVVHGRGARAVAARLKNLVARLEGSDDGPALLLLTHYDSVPTGPGAGDDAAGVAAVLEALRALRAEMEGSGGAPLRNDLIVLVTDGEESGLLGARLFVDEHPWAGDVGLVLNFEARGNSGLVNMFETSEGNARLIRGLASAPHPFASSMSAEVYRRMPNDTDLTVFLEAGHPGLNFAMIGNHPAYHTELDTPAALSRASLQHHGSYVLALMRHFGRADLADLDAPDSVYFNPLGGWLVAYGEAVGKVLALVAAAALLALLLWGVQRRRLSWSGLRGGMWAWLLVLAGGSIVLGALWNLFERLFPAALATLHGEPCEAGVVRLAALLVVLGLAGSVGVVLQRPTTLDMLGGLLVPWALAGAALAFLIPGAGYLFLWPLIGGTLGLGVALGRRSGVAPGALSAAGALVAGLLFAPTIVLVTEALQVNAAVLLGAVLALPVTLAVPPLRAAVADRLEIPAALALVGVACLGWVGGRAAPSPSSPAPTSLTYAFDAETSQAWWLSYETRTDEWTGQVIPEEAEPESAPGFLPGAADTLMLSAAAPVVDLPGPSAELVADSFEDDVRLLELRIRSSRAAPFVMVRLGASMATLEAVGVEGRMAEVDDSSGEVTLTIENLPSEGVVVTVRTFDRQPLAVDVIDWSWGLPAVEGAPLEPRPPHLVRRPRWLTDAVLVRRSFWF